MDKLNKEYEKLQGLNVHDKELWYQKKHTENFRRIHLQKKTPYDKGEKHQMVTNTQRHGAKSCY